MAGILRAILLAASYEKNVYPSGVLLDLRSIAYWQQGADLSPRGEPLEANFDVWSPIKPARAWLADFLTGNPDKEHHEWGQGVEEAQYYIERLIFP